MRVLEAGHTYALQSLDGGDWETLRFVKREGPGYPGNKGHHPGTIIQEVCRALIDRLDYVNKQIPCKDNRDARMHLEIVIWLLEKRAAERHERGWDQKIDGLEKLPTCSGCGHVGCPGCSVHSSPKMGSSTK